MKVWFAFVFVTLCFIFLMGAKADPPVRLVPVEEERELNGMLPQVSFDKLPEVAALFSSGELIWYTDKEVPPAYQLQNTFHSPFYNISNQNERNLAGQVIGKDRVGNGNRDFPWAATAGTDACSDVEIFRFVRLPKEDGKLWPIVYFTGPNPGSNLPNPNNRNRVLGEGGGATSSQRWMYPAGTVVGELLCMQGPDDLLYPFEVRMRFRQRDYWEVEVIRPYDSPKKLKNAIKELRPDWWENNNLIKVVKELDEPTITKGSVRDTNRNQTAFGSNFKKHQLPEFKDDRLVAELLTTATWTSVQGLHWVEGVTAPTAPKGCKFHIVPEEYAAHMVEVNSESCKNCHQHTGTNVRVFDQNRGWYGRVRGNDNILSLHPIAPSAISYDGRNIQPALRTDFVQAGVVATYDQRKHPSSRYSPLKQ